MNNVIFWSGVWGDPNYRQEYVRALGPYQLGHWLLQHNISYQVIEFVQLLSVQDIIELTEMSITSKTFAIGISTTFWPFGDTVPNKIIELVNYFKQKYPHIKIVGGGPRVNKLTTLEANIFDITFPGEAEDSFLKWCQEQKYKVSIPSIKFDITNSNNNYLKQDIILENEALPIELGRGCIFKCKFCAYPNIGKLKHTYQKRFSLIENELIYNNHNFGTTNYLVMDSTANEDVEKVIFLSNLKKNIGFGIKWKGFLRADLIWSHKNYYELLESGLNDAYFGLESFHPKTLNLIGKGWNKDKAQDYIPHLYNNIWNRQVGIEGTFIIGLPYDTEESMRESLNWVKENKLGNLFYVPYNIRSKEEEGSPMSEFEKDSIMYYDFNTDGSWINKTNDMTQYRAMQLVHEFNSETLFGINTVAGWLSGTLHNLGYSIEEIHNTPMSHLPHITARHKDEFVAKYKKEFTSYYNIL